MRKGITPTQQKLLDALIADERRSVRELVEISGLSSTSSVVYHLVRLESLGYLERGPCGQARAWRVCNRPDMSARAAKVIERARLWAHRDPVLAAALHEYEMGRS